MEVQTNGFLFLVRSFWFLVCGFWFLVRSCLFFGALAASQIWLTKNYFW